MKFTSQTRYAQVDPWEHAARSGTSGMPRGFTSLGAKRAPVDRLLRENYRTKEGQYLGSPKPPKKSKTTTTNEQRLEAMVRLFGPEHPRVVAIRQELGI